MCIFCKSKEEKPSTTTHTVDNGDSVIVLRNVPCIECVQCGEIYYSDEVVEQLEDIVNKAKNLISQEFSVINFKKVA